MKIGKSEILTCFADGAVGTKVLDEAADEEPKPVPLGWDSVENAVQE